jgi:hypothetical protein
MPSPAARRPTSPSCSARSAAITAGGGELPLVHTQTVTKAICRMPEAPVRKGSTKAA